MVPQQLGSNSEGIMELYTAQVKGSIKPTSTRCEIRAFLE